MIDNDVRSSIRAKIRPFTRTKIYPTGWAGRRTFEQIYEDLIPSFNRLLRYYCNHELDIPDLIAHAFMRLWMDISADTSMLAAVEKGGAIKLLLNRTNPQLYRKFYHREIYLEDIATRSDNPDDFIIDGFDHSHIIGYATYAEIIELRIDIEKVITELAEKYMESLPYLELFKLCKQTWWDGLLAEVKVLLRLFTCHKAPSNSYMVSTEQSYSIMLPTLNFVYAGNAVHYKYLA